MRDMRCFSLIFTLLLSYGYPGLLAAQDATGTLPGGRSRVRIPVEIRHNLVLLKLTINGSMPLLFILDTGVRNTLLVEPILLPLLRLDTAGMTSALIRGLGSPEPIPATRYRNIRINAGDCMGDICTELPPMDMLVMPEGAISYGGMFGLPIAGIIGGEIFSRFVVRINYMESFIELIDPQSFSLPGNKWSSLPLTIRGGKPYAEGTLMLPDSSTVKRSFLLDSGSSSAVLYRDQQTATPERALHAVIGTGIGGSMMGKLCRYPALYLGEYELKRPIIGIPDSLDIATLPQETGYYGNLGAEVLSRFQVYFDYPHFQLHLRPNTTFHQAFTYSYSGLEIAHPAVHDPTLVIINVRPASPAHRAGLLPGDTLTRIQLLPTQTMDIQEAYARLNPDPGRGVCVTVLRGGRREQQICYRSEDEL